MSQQTATTESEIVNGSRESSMREIVADLFTPNATIYLFDLTVSALLGYGLMLAAMLHATFDWLQCTYYVGSALAMYRAGFFIHEIAHFRSGEMKVFRGLWHVLIGLPTFTYASHSSHHNTQQYGTPSDGEYLPLGSGNSFALAQFLLAPLVYPLLFAFRYLVIAPLSFLHPRLRHIVLRDMSSLVINFQYRREPPSNAPRGKWALAELLFAGRLGAVIGLMYLGVLPWRGLLDIYVIAVVALVVNQIRTLLSHRYLGDGDRMSYQDQIGDSINITGDRWVTELVFPLASRYHALHHAFPTIPYHNLAAAHNRLVAELPPSSNYCRATYATAWQVLTEFVCAARELSRQTPSPAATWYQRRAGKT